MCKKRSAHRNKTSQKSAERKLERVEYSSVENPELLDHFKRKTLFLSKK